MLLALLTLACAGAPEPADTAASLEFTPPQAPAYGTQIVLDGIEVPPGEELEMCRYLKAAEAPDGMVTRIELAARDGLHHVFVVKSSRDLEDGEEACFGLPDAAMEGYNVPEPLFASSTQVTHEEMAFPEGVGVDFGAGQQLIFNYHYLNLGDETLTGEIYLNLHYAAPDETVEEAALFVFGNITGIDIPAGGTQTLTTTCGFSDDVNVASITPHMHSMGTGFEVRHSETGEVLLADDGWYNPETAYFDPGLKLSVGEGLEFSCTWDNPTDAAVGFGQTSTDEMCFLFGYHWPADGLYWKMDYDGCVVAD